MILYPEGLEMSNMIYIMNDDLSFNIEEFFKLKEINKIFSDKEYLIEVIFQFIIRH